jgi:uncharacterized protein (DUF1919 family)
MTVNEKFRSLFPLKGMITQEIIDNSDRYCSNNCVGALTLKAALGENFELICVNVGLWIDVTGYVLTKDNYTTRLKTLEEIPMMKVLEPQEVTFVLDNK